jgi:hypothetical protein
VHVGGRQVANRCIGRGTTGASILPRLRRWWRVASLRDRRGLRGLRRRRRCFVGNLRARRARQPSHARRDVHYRLELDFLDAVNGAKRQLTLPDKSALDVTIPARHGRRRVLPATAGDWHGVPRLVRAPYRGLRCIYGSDALEECRGAAKMSTRRRRVRRRSAPPACTPRTPSKSWRVNGAKIRRIAGLVNS